MARLALSQVITGSSVGPARPYLSAPYLWAVTGLTNQQDCVALATTGSICKSTVQRDLRAQVLPNHWSFDDGRLRVDAGISLDEMQTLYYALKQVSAQTARVVETLDPVPGDVNSTLVMNIYPSRADYERAQPFLTGLDTANGGIYIENGATFYTYQRTAADSIYTLEELTRHEYTHYLIGRYVIPGTFGGSPLYDNNRLTWFDEGIAEFLAGSTQYTVAPRANLVRQVAWDASRMPVSSILYAGYGDFVFYRYAGLLFGQWYANSKTTLHDFVAAARRGDVAGIDALRAQLAASPTAEAAYTAFLDDQIARYDSLADPSTTYVSATSLPTGDPWVIQNAFRGTQAGIYGDCNAAAWALNGRYLCKGQLTTSLFSTADWQTAWSQMNADVNRIISTLQPPSPQPPPASCDPASCGTGGTSTPTYTNFNDLVCSMGAMTWIPYSHGPGVYAYVDYHCEGPLPSQNVPTLARPAQETADFESTRLGIYTTCTATSSLVTCTSSESTSLFAASATDAQIRAAFDENTALLRSEVYALRPFYYKNLSCQSDAASLRIYPYGTGRYMVGNAVCTLPY